jgi:hypothetical protein
MLLLCSPQVWPADARETFWAQAVAKTGTDFGL